MLKKYRKIIIFILVVVLSFVLYTIFLKPQAEQALLDSSGPAQVNAVGQEIIDTLNRIQSLELDKSVFNDPLYLRLRDDSQPIEDEDLGRSNPFEPLSGQSNNINIDFEAQEIENDEEGGENIENSETQEAGLENQNNNNQ
ncbi:hypothetical protein GW764_03205 [Candidatus Parcubacteria bacterium]|nr:hypothetical protein [Candidatus Parcubacteria bacterium]